MIRDSVSGALIHGDRHARRAVRRAGLNPGSGQPVAARSGKNAATVVPRPT